MKNFFKVISIFTLCYIGFVNATVTLSVSNSATDGINIEPYYYMELQARKTTVATGAENTIVAFLSDKVNTINIRLNPSNWSGSPVRVPLSAFPFQNGKYIVTITCKSTDSSHVTVYANAYDASGIQYKSIFTKSQFSRR